MSKIQENIKRYHQKVSMPGGWTHSLPETLKMIDRFYYSKFRDGEFDSQGFYKFFVNIVKYPCEIAKKYIDLDTKDIIAIPKPGHEFKSFLLIEDLKQWMKTNEFGEVINEIEDRLPKYGHAVLKIVKGEPEVLNIENLRLDPSVNELEDSDFVYEVHLMSRGEIEEQVGWDTTNLLKTDDEVFLVYECYHKKGKKWEREYVADVWTCRNRDGSITRGIEEMINSESDFVPHHSLKKDMVSKLPYREHKFENVPGRWLGYGFVEYLEPNQISENEAENIERKGLALSSLNLLMTRDTTIGGSNILASAENGDILTVEDDLRRVPLEERNLAAMNATRARNATSIERKTFSTDIARGANLPSRTPIGVAQIQQDAVESFFSVKREELGMFLKELIEEDVLDTFKKKNHSSHIITIMGNEESAAKFDEYVSEMMLSKAIADHATKTGFYPNADQRAEAKQRIMAELSRNKNKFADLVDGFYDDVENTIDIVITDETMDTGARGQMINMMLQIVGTNPAILSNPTAKKMLMRLAALGGVNAQELGLDIEPAQPQQQQPQQAGSLSTPQPVGVPSAPTQM
jgi:hypothetical protein